MTRFIDAPYGVSALRRIQVSCKTRQNSDPSVDARYVCFIFPPPQAVLSVDSPLVLAGNGVLVWLRPKSLWVVCARGRCSGRRRGDVLVSAVSLVRSLFCALRRDLRGCLDVVRAASL